MKTFEDWLQGKMLGSMEKEFARDAWNAAIEALEGDGVLVRLERVEGYEDVHPDLVAEDAINWPDYEVLSK